MKRAILTGLLLALLLAPTAHAGWRIDRAATIARIVWHHPCVDRMQFRWGPVPASADNGSAWTWVDDCAIWFDESQPLAWEPFCTLTLHEAGHLAGMGHTDHGVMSSLAIFEHELAVVNGRRVSRWLGTDQRCRDRGRPYLKAHGQL